MRMCRLFTFTLLAGLLPAQARNVQLLANFAPEGKSTSKSVMIYNDVWGYTDPTTGKEYAILGSGRGTYIVDVSTPSRPVQRGFIAASASGWRNSAWRDMKTYRTYAYVVTEGGGGMQILDLTNPDRPRLVKTWGTNLWPNTHNIAIDPQAGLAAVCGTRTGMHFIDLKTDPLNPKIVATIRSPYIHDLHIQNGRAHCAELYSNNYLVLDVSSLPTTSTLARVRMPGARYSHSMWAAEDDRYLLSANETSGGPVAVWDIRNIRSPVVVARYQASSSTFAIPHNPFLKEYVGHISYYTEGYRVIDVSQPGRPVEVGYYDTWGGTSGGFAGAWGCYPFTDSGLAFVSDIQSGLYILKPKATGAHYGKATSGTNGRAPQVGQYGAPYLGNAYFELRGRNGRPRSPAYFALGFQKVTWNVNGLILNLIPVGLFPTSTDSRGQAAFPVSLPAQGSLNGLKVLVQFFVADPAGPMGFAASRGLELELFTP